MTGTATSEGIPASANQSVADTTATVHIAATRMRTIIGCARRSPLTVTARIRGAQSHARDGP